MRNVKLQRWISYRTRRIVVRVRRLWLHERHGWLGDWVDISLRLTLIRHANSKRALFEEQMDLLQESRTRLRKRWHMTSIYARALGREVYGLIKLA